MPPCRKRARTRAASVPSWKVGHERAYYWDRWKCDSISLPVVRHMILYDDTLDCGEYGMVGYANERARRSGSLWLAHAVERFERLGINHNVWGVRGGFTWSQPEFRKTVLRYWTEPAKR